MKRQLTVALGLLVVAAPAFATKARLEALGEDNFGSYYVNDNRNIFLNPARINENKDLVTYEFGANSSNLAGPDTASTPRAGGGFNKAYGNMVYGLHFGDSSPSTGLVRALPGTPGALQERQPWDLFVGGDAGVKWGASFTYESHDGGSAAGGNRLASNGMRVRGGVIMGDLDVFAHVSLANSAKDFAGNQVKGDAGYFLGAGYMMNNYKLFADLRMIGAKYSGATTAPVGGGKKNADVNILRVGIARQERLNDRATLFAKVMATRTGVDDKGAGYGAVVASSDLAGPGKETTYALPVVVGLEYAATSWLDLRASVVNNVYSSQDTNNKAGKDTKGNVAATAVNAGASLKFGEFSVDGLISTNSTGASTAGAGTPSQDTSGGNGALRTDTLMTRVSMIYRF